MADCSNILSYEALYALRASYKEEDGNTLLLAGADANLIGAYAAAGPFVTWVSERFYKPGMFAPRERELMLLSILADGPALTLSIHVYWGLMEGLSPKEIAECLLMTSAYRGLPLYANQVRVLQATLTALEALYQQGSTSVQVAVGTLVKTNG